MALDVNDNVKLLLHKKHILENSINELLVKFHNETGLWVQDIDIFRKTSSVFGESYKDTTTGHYVKTFVPLEEV